MSTGRPTDAAAATAGAVPNTPWVGRRAGARAAGGLNATDPFARSFLEGRGDDDIRTLNSDFLTEAEALGLVFQCADCEHYDPAGRTCSLDYPSADLMAVFDTGVVLHQSGHTFFCKHFEAL
ncbi:MAG: hypothetical protein IV100_26145 [Myxococcales bacterium]|nr:hypothetical protein [Myxococcales bacterium]